MNHWIIADTHFGHDKLQKLAGRPKGFEEKILGNLGGLMSDNVLIHLGDICIGKDAEFWHERLDSSHHAQRRWLIKGNHDSKSNQWYLNHSWDFVADQIRIKKYGLEIVLSHCPIAEDTWDLNIHGHHHNVVHHDTSVVGFKHYLVMMEHDYRPVMLKTIVNKFRRKV